MTLKANWKTLSAWATLTLILTLLKLQMGEVGLHHTLVAQTMIPGMPWPCDKSHKKHHVYVSPEECRFGVAFMCSKQVTINLIFVGYGGRRSYLHTSLLSKTGLNIITYCEVEFLDLLLVAKPECDTLLGESGCVFIYYSTFM